MSTFDPNNDYTKDQQQESLYMTVLEVQKVLQEITSLLQMNEEQPQKIEQLIPESDQDDDDDQDLNDENRSTIYDDIFQ
jgi:hypothetical protein